MLLVNCQHLDLAPGPASVSTAVATKKPFLFRNGTNNELTKQTTGQTKENTEKTTN